MRCRFEATISKRCAVGKRLATRCRFADGQFRLGPPSPGTLYSNPEFNIMPTHGTAPLRLGTRDLGSFLRGGLDEVAIYPYVLSANKIQEHYKIAMGD